MNVRSLVVPLAAAITVEAILTGLVVASTLGVSEKPTELAPLPQRPVFQRIRAPLAPLVERFADNATTYLNMDAPSFGLAPPLPGVDPGIVGDRVILETCGDVPLEVREAEFAFEVSEPTTLAIHVSVWDGFSTSSVPVHSGLLRMETVDFGPAPLAAGSYVTSLVFSPALALADPDTFWLFELRTSGSGSQPFAPARMVFALRDDGPEVGSQGTANNYYRDVNPNGPNPPTEDGVLTHPGDARAFASSGQSNLYLWIRGAPDPAVLAPGTIPWESPGNGSAFLNVTPYGAPGAFDYDDRGDSCAPVPFEVSSDPIEGSVALRGEPLVTSPPGVLGTTAFVLKRASRICLPPPHETASFPIEVAAMSLVTASPMTITYDFGNYVQQWDAAVRLSVRPPPPGTMTITKDGCSEDGGSLSAVLPILPKIVFTRRPPDPPCTITYDLGVMFFPPVVLSLADGHWSSAGTPALLQVPEDGVEFDRGGDGVVSPGEAFLTPGSTGFQPGLRALRCDRDACGPSSGPVRRLAVATAAELTISLLRTADPGAQEDQDGDLVPDEADGCPRSPDPPQLDADHDGIGDACDNCLAACNPDQSDADADTTGDACDCPQGAPPEEVERVTLAADHALAWTAALGATRYEIVRGLVGGLPVGPGGADEACLGPAASPMLVDPATPAAATAFFYLVRGVNDCAAGPLGYRGEHGGRTSVERTTTCP